MTDFSVHLHNKFCDASIRHKDWNFVEGAYIILLRAKTYWYGFYGHRKKQSILDQRNIWTKNTKMNEMMQINVYGVLINFLLKHLWIHNFAENLQLSGMEITAWVVSTLFNWYLFLSILKRAMIYTDGIWTQIVEKTKKRNVAEQFVLRVDIRGHTI